MPRLSSWVASDSDTRRPLPVCEPYTIVASEATPAAGTIDGAAGANCAAPPCAAAKARGVARKPLQGLRVEAVDQAAEQLNAIRGERILGDLSGSRGGEQRTDSRHFCPRVILRAGRAGTERLGCYVVMRKLPADQRNAIGAGRASIYSISIAY